MGFLVNITYNLFFVCFSSNKWKAATHQKKWNARPHIKGWKKKVIVFFKVDFHWTRCKIFLACCWVFTVYVSMNRCKWYCFTLVKHEWGRKEDQAVRCFVGKTLCLHWAVCGSWQGNNRSMVDDDEAWHML